MREGTFEKISEWHMGLRGNFVSGMAAYPGRGQTGQVFYIVSHVAVEGE